MAKFLVVFDHYIDHTTTTINSMVIEADSHTMAVEQAESIQKILLMSHNEETSFDVHLL